MYPNLFNNFEDYFSQLFGCKNITQLFGTALSVNMPYNFPAATCNPAFEVQVVAPLRFCGFIQKMLRPQDVLSSDAVCQLVFGRKM